MNYLRDTTWRTGTCFVDCLSTQLGSSLLEGRDWSRLSTTVSPVSRAGFLNLSVTDV